jgi:hypothetical protein
MLHKRFMSIGFAMAMIFVMVMAVGQAVAQEKAAAPAAPQAKPTIAKLCTNCHQAEPGNLRGNFDGVAYKSQSIQIKIDDVTEILKFDKEKLQLVNIPPFADSPSESLYSLKRGKEIRIAYTEKDGVKFATLVSAKTAIKVSPEKQMTTAAVEKLVAMGPETGKYLLIDARPAPRFMEGSIPTAVNIPFAAFDKMTEKLPKDKNAQIIYYCAGVT